jgi:type I restriction enzyme R subunit
VVCLRATRRDGVPVTYRDNQGRQRSARARVTDFDRPGNNRFLAVRELKLTGMRTPNYNRRADLVCFVNGLPLVFIELKAVYKDIRTGFDGNLYDYMDEHVIAHAFHHNAFLILSNGERARYGSITCAWEHFNEWKRLDEADRGSLEAERLLNGMLAHERLLDIVERAHPDLGRLGVFWHTQGGGKSYSMAFFAEKVRRKVPGNRTFLLMTDRQDLDGQIYKTFVGCGIAGNETPRAASGDDLERILKENHAYVFSLIHKFNKDVDPGQPYSERDDIIVISDEAHRTQAGRLARNMRLALPNAAFIGFTGTPLFKQDELTKRIFGTYVSRYDFKRSEEDGATVKLVYENRGEKLGVARTDLNERMAARIEQAELDPD